MMRKSTKRIILPLLCATAILTAGVSHRSQAAQPEAAPDFVKVYGTVNGLEEGRLSITRQDGDFAGQELFITLSEETKVLDAVNGYPVSPEQIQSGETVYAYIGPAMTLSLPPMAHGELILCQIPADYQVPEYITVNSLTVNSDQISGSIQSSDGTVYQVPSDCQILPYLTRNIVTLHDLSEGKRCLVWTQGGSQSAYKIVAFADSGAADGTGGANSANNTETLAPSGWVLDDGIWYFYESGGGLHTGWLMDGRDWYYLDPASGAMQTGFLTLDKSTYYLLPDGRMLTAPMTFTPDEHGALH